MNPNVPTQEFIEWLKSLSPEQIAYYNQQQNAHTERVWEKFKTYFEKGTCSLCNEPLQSFYPLKPCLHWLLTPEGFTKKHFHLIYKKFTYFRMAAYVRWVATIDAPFKNINDIKAEHPGDKLIDFTARCKNLTWSFSCSPTDHQGHKNSEQGNFPHYHFQMFVNELPFIDYSDFHIPFHEDDLYNIELFAHKNLIFHRFGVGIGMSELLEKGEGLEFIIESPSQTCNRAEAACEIDTLIMASVGETISGELLNEAIEEAKASGKTIASVVKKKIKNANIATIVSAGEGVPEAKQRTGGRKRK